MEYGAAAPLELLTVQAAEAFGVWPPDRLHDAEGSLFWLALWRELKNAEAARLRRELEGA